MPHMSLRYLKVDGEPIFPGAEPVIHDVGGDWTAIVIEHGMGSGNPSVALVVETDKGMVILETSLLSFQAAARGLVGMAETNFGWEMPP